MSIETKDGQCACGCGLIANTLEYDCPKTGRRAGQHYKYVSGGHYAHHMRILGLWSGKQADRKKLIELRRGQLVRAVLGSNGKYSLQEISREVAPEFRLEGCVVMLRSAREWQWWDGENRSERIPHILVKKPNQIRPRYERPDIENERETEIPFLVNRRSVLLLDAPLIGSERSRHETFASRTLTPLEILLLKEQSEEDEERERRIAEWNRWMKKRNSAFYYDSLQTL